MVDLAGVEPATSSMPLKRAPNCATGPGLLYWPISSTFAKQCQTPEQAGDNDCSDREVLLESPERAAYDLDEGGIGNGNPE